MALTQQQIENLCVKRPVRVVEGAKIMTGPVRLAFPSLHKATAIKDGKPKFNTLGTFPHNNLGPFKETLMAAVRQHYPKYTDPMLLLATNNKDHPLKDQGLRVSTDDGGLDPVGKTIMGFTPGLIYINPKSGNRVPCFQAVGGVWKSVMPEEIEEIFYPGCWCELKVAIGKSTVASKPGLNLYLDGVWKLADDDRMGGGGSNASADEGGSADDVMTIEDPNAALTSSGGGWGGNTATPADDASSWG